jgi:hypothetical protein
MQRDAGMDDSKLLAKGFGTSEFVGMIMVRNPEELEDETWQETEKKVVARYTYIHTHTHTHIHTLTHTQTHTRVISI